MTENTELAQATEQAKAITVTDTSAFAALMDSEKFNQLWRVSQVFAGSDMTPAQFKNKPGNCMIVLQMAFRLGVDPMQLMQNCCVIHGKPSIESKLAIALLNNSGSTRGSIGYEFDGKGDDYGCYAYATTKDGEIIHGPKVTWKMVKAEGWNSKTGSKWKTMPELMFRYRAAMFLIRTHFPEAILGMQSVDEAEDIISAQEATQAPPAQSKTEILATEIIDSNEGATDDKATTTEEEQG